MNQLDPHSWASEAKTQSLVYRFRQHKKLFKLTGLFLLIMLGYTLIEREFVPFLEFNFISFTTAMIILFIGEYRLKRGFENYFRYQQTGQDTNWISTAIIWNMWWIYAVDIMILYWIFTFICTLLFPFYIGTELFSIP